VERTGRGVETVYRGQLRNGRQLPNYAHSNEGGVLVVLDAGPADLDFVRLLVQASRRLDRPLAVTDLLALWMARREGLTHAAILAPEMQSAVAQAQDLLASLAQAGLLEKAAQAYRIAPELYRAAEVKPRPVVPEDAILGYLATHGRITRSEVVSVCGVSERQASYLLQKLTQQGRLVRQGSHRGSGYALAKASPAAHLE
jgi:ATP-dependent DNA helicase RecG